MRSNYYFVLCLAILTINFGAVNGAGGADDSLFAEYEIKGAFLYKFVKFTEWPQTSFPDSTTPLSICIFGNDPFGDTLNTLRGAQVQGRSLNIRSTTKIEELKGCHVVFVCASEKNRFDETLAAVRGLPILTIGEAEEFTHGDGAVSFITNGKKVHLEINLGLDHRFGHSIV